MSYKTHSMSKINKLALLSAVISSIYANTALAEEPIISLNKAVETAILTNPEILQSYKTYEAAVKDANAAFGRYLPSVELIASTGAEDRRDPLVSQNTMGTKYQRSQATLSLKQMIFDGFATKNEIARLDKTSKAKLYELESTSQSVALEATKSYIDLLRYRSLVSLAEDNYVAHKIIYEQLQLKAQAGVGKKSDVEQARSRLSLADYNMTVEGSNLHDIEARYQRLMGTLPPKEVNVALPVDKDIPLTAIDAVKYAQLNSPQLLATIEDIKSQDALVNFKTSAFVPKVDFRARTEAASDLNGYNGSYKNDVAEIVVSWNLFNGGTDYNLKQKEVKLLEAAMDRRDRTCRDIRLELEIAYNDIKKLTEQVNYLDNRQISIEKARDAYRKQFEIGQRTLIDLLNAENEVFEAKRLYTNASSDLAAAKARTHHKMGTLLSTLGLTRIASAEAPLPTASSLDGASIAACPAEVPTGYKANHQDLDSRALEGLSIKK